MVLTAVVVEQISVVEILESEKLSTVIAVNALSFGLLVDLVAVHAYLNRTSKFLNKSTV